MVNIAGFEGHTSDDALAAELDAFPDPKHLLLHEVIHSDNLMNGMDFSYRALARVAALKADHPELVHTMLTNHELSQVIGAGIIKGGVRVVEAFNAGLEFAFGDDHERVADAIAEFVRSMPIALRCVSRIGDILCAHSLPGVGVMHKFDATIIERDLTDDDYMPRKGSAHLMVWGRGYDADQLEDLVERWGINLFILGHEHVPGGARLIKPNAVIINSDHNEGVYLPIDLEHPPRAEDAVGMVHRLSDS